MTNDLVQTSNNRLVQEVKAHKLTIERLENSVEKLNQELEETKTGNNMKWSVLTQ